MTGVGSLAAVSNKLPSPKDRIVRVSLDQQAANLLREQMISGRLKAGDKLVESQLASDFGVSRGTMRIALRKLAVEGLIQQVPFSWWIVAPLSAKDAWELYTLRASLEGLAASLAAERKDAASRRRIRSAFDALKAACATGDYARVTEADLTLHRTIVEVTGHERLLAHWRLIEQQTRVFLASSNALLQDIRDIADEHQAIVNAILGGQPKAAERHAQALFLKDGADLVRHLDAKERQATEQAAKTKPRRKQATAA
jgi:DNA-binding GntR family transcriptional regulator